MEKYSIKDIVRLNIPLVCMVLLSFLVPLVEIGIAVFVLGGFALILYGISAVQKYNRNHKNKLYGILMLVVYIGYIVWGTQLTLYFSQILY